MIKFLVLLFISYHSYLVSCDQIEIDLSLYHPNEHKYNVFTKYYNITDDNTEINIKNIQDNIGFFLIQVHTYLENVTLSFNSNLTRGFYTSGTNTGLVLESHNTSAIFYLFRNSKVDITLQILIAINVYNSKDPIPGGCNLSFDTEIAPYQVTNYDDHVITVKNQPPSIKGFSCDNNTVQLDMYHLFLHEYDNSIDTYFNGIEKMLTVENIIKHGKKVPDKWGAEKYMRLYSLYVGTGEIFAIISTYKNQSSCYVPAVSYGCDLLKWKESCLVPVAIHWKFLCACQLIFGIFICFFGHQFFRLTLYIVSFTFGLIMTYFFISIEEYLSITERTITAFTVGFIYGLIWLLIWHKYGVPCLAANLAFILSGFLAASLLFYTVLADISFSTRGIYYWMVFLCLTIACVLLSTINAMYGHITSLSFISAYASVMSLNYYFGGNLPYIIINTYRRIAVQNFNLAVIAPPFQIIDLLQALLWVALALFGMYIQIRNQRGKAPFPPNRPFREFNTLSETTPLIHHDIFTPPPYIP